MQSNEQQKFQSQGKLFALQVHAVYMKVENFFTWPFRWLANAVSLTPDWQAMERKSLRVVK